MQLMLDTLGDPTSTLRAIAALLIQACDARDVNTAPAGEVAPPPPPSTPSPAEIFGQPSAAAVFASGGAPEQPATVTTVSPPPPVAPPPVAPPIVGEAALGAAQELAVVVSTTQANIPAVEVDSAGVLYDPAIHSSSRAKVKGGTWKKRRGGPAESKAPPVPATVTPPAAVAPPPTTPPAPPAPPPVGAPVAAVAPPPPASPAAAEPAADAVTFRSLMAKVGAAQQAGKLTPERIAELCKDAGAPDLMTLNAMPSLIPVVNQKVDAELAKVG